MRIRKLPARIEFNRKSMMKVAMTLGVAVGLCVAFIGLKTGRIHHHGARSNIGIMAHGAESSAASPSTAVNTDASKTGTLTGEAAREELRKCGQYESLGAAFQAARYAAEKIDPAGPHSRGAEYFASNPKQQLRVWFRHDGIELASGRRAKDGNAKFV